jgi:hypothetical protein
MADSPNVTKAHSRNVPESDVLDYSRALLLSCCALVAFAIANAPLVSHAAGRQLPLAPINLLPNAPTTYQMRDWRQVATDFDNLAFNTTATGQFLPLMRIDNTYQPPQPQGQTWFGLPAYVGETRTFGETGEPIHEAIASLGAVLGGTLVGRNKTTGPYNWVAMSREYYVDRNSQFVVLNTPFSVSGQSAWYEVFPNILFYSIADRYPGESTLQTALNTIDLRFKDAVNVLTAGGTAPNFNDTFSFFTKKGIFTKSTQLNFFTEPSVIVSYPVLPIYEITDSDMHASLRVDNSMIVPEPGTSSLVALGICFAVFARRCRRDDV